VFDTSLERSRYTSNSNASLERSRYTSNSNVDDFQYLTSVFTFVLYLFQTRLRGNLEWAPPRAQIIFNIHQTQR